MHILSMHCLVVLSRTIRAV